LSNKYKNSLSKSAELSNRKYPGTNSDSNPTIPLPVPNKKRKYVTENPDEFEGISKRLLNYPSFIFRSSKKR